MKLVLRLIRERRTRLYHLWDISIVASAVHRERGTVWCRLWCTPPTPLVWMFLVPSLDSVRSTAGCVWCVSDQAESTHRSWYSLIIATTQSTLCCHPFPLLGSCESWRIFADVERFCESRGILQTLGNFA